MTFSITGLGTANPKNYLTQKEILRHFLDCHQLSESEKELYIRILSGEKIQGRYVGLEETNELLITDHDYLLSRFKKYGIDIALQAAEKALAQAGVKARDVKGLIVNTCTGYMCPGLSSYIAEKLGLTTAIGVRDIMGMGCGAAVPNLECACGMLATAEQGPVLGIAVEICSSTIFPAHDPGLIVSNCIFGDGAAAFVVDSSESSERKMLARIIGFESGCYPEFREELRYTTEKGLLRNHLSKKVPVIGAKTVAEVTERLLTRYGLFAQDIDWWAVHPGGTAVLMQIAKKMKISETALDFSFEVFNHYGNMSSPSVLFVLEKILEKGHPNPGEKALMLSFGAGFTAFAALLEF